MHYIAILFLTLFTTTFATQAFAEEDIAALRSEIASLKAQQSQTEVEALKKELSELKIKMLEEKLANTEKRLEDKISTSEKRLDDKISTSEKQTDNKFEAKTDNLDTKIQLSNSQSALNIGNNTTDAKTSATAKPRPFALSIGAASASLKSTNYGDTMNLSGIAVGVSYTKNRFFAETLITSASRNDSLSTTSYSTCSWYSYYCGYSYNYYNLKTSLSSLDLRLGYKFGGNIVKFEPYVGIGGSTIALTLENTSTYAKSKTSAGFLQFTPGAKLSIGSSNVRGFIDVTVPSVISKNAEYDAIGYKPTAITKLGLSFAF